MYRVLGPALFAGDLWHFGRRSVANGVALGLFVAFTPTIPFHMVLAAVGAVCLRVNLPVALAACWVSNPVTILPMYWAGWKIGHYVLAAVPWLTGPLQTRAADDDKWAAVEIHSLYLWTGCLILAVLAASAGHLVVRLLARGLLRFRKEEKCQDGA